jgi:hypothetical protein
VASRARASRFGALVFLLAAPALLVVSVVRNHRTDHSLQLTAATHAPTSTTRAPTTTTVARSTTTVAPAGRRLEQRELQPLDRCQLHVSHGSSIAGCVALPTDQLLSLLRWLDPGRAPVIAIGTREALTTS